MTSREGAWIAKNVPVTEVKAWLMLVVLHPDAYKSPSILELYDFRRMCIASGYYVNKTDKHSSYDYPLTGINQAIVIENAMAHLDILNKYYPEG